MRKERLGIDNVDPDTVKMSMDSAEHDDDLDKPISKDICIQKNKAGSIFRLLEEQA